MAKTLVAVFLTLTAAGMGVACGDDDRTPITPPVPVALKVNSVVPGIGTTAGGTAIQIIGTGFVNGTTLTLDGASVPVTFVNASLLRSTAPPHAAGRIDVEVRNPSGETSRLAGGFTYVAQAVALEITGNLSLQSVGQTTQLTATVSYADGSTKDVTSEVEWTISLPSVASFTQPGLVTAHALGATSIFVSYRGTPNLFKNAQLTVTPPGTFTSSGRVRQPGAGGIRDVDVKHQDSGQSARTDQNGLYSLGGLTGRIRMAFSKPDYEPVEMEGTRDGFLDIPMQPVVRLAAGATYSSTFAPNDVEYMVGASMPCQPCRMIRVTGSSGGTAQLKLTWSAAVPLQIWVDGQAFAPPGTAREIVVDVPLGSGEARIYVGREKPTSPGNYISFTLTVS